MWIFLIIILVLIVAAVCSFKKTDEDINNRLHGIDAKLEQDRQSAIVNQQAIILKNELTLEKQLIVGSTVIALDTIHSCLLVNETILPFSQIIDVEVLTETKASTQKEGGIGRAIVGVVIAGGIGAIVGASTAKETTTVDTGIIGTKIYTSNIDNPSIEITHYGRWELYDIVRAIIAKNQSASSNA